MSGLVVGFDLDMTLIDARAGMVDQVHAIGRKTGIPLDGVAFIAELGPPLRQKFREQGVPEDRMDEFIDLFRADYPEVVIPGTVALPGAAEAIKAVHAVGGRAVVVTAKHTPNAELHVKALGWTVDAVIGGLWAAAKAPELVRQGAQIFVGDHEGDMVGALAAGAVPVGVTSGPCSAAELRAAGAAVVLADLGDFPTWLAGWIKKQA
ncbi:putative hydrolase [Alloactinosynnema sp. L-07]|uniref:HAD family hydrolase n=1 Tax=Alloactinosynnema sp. L-07 TaxID=1653480 RepID=UPI00065F0196|nr:haloacid dehalogenase-like hydrolase [Alloactinosynnema sp. L-07]CRK55949.1 putative hydrolase [Alloactinosynnema sp. L-07]